MSTGQCRQLVLLCGPAFSGKSTAAEVLRSQFRATVISLDAIMAARGNSPGAGAPVAEWAAAHQEAKRRVADAMCLSSACVAVDDTNCFRFLRDAFRALAQAHNYAVCLIVFRVGEGELRRRRAANEVSSAREPISESVFREHLAAFEWPLADERAITWEEWLAERH